MNNRSDVVLPLTRALVLRGTSTAINVTVPEHELPVLRVVHGGQSVQVLGPAEYDGEVDTITLPASAEAEWDRLSRKYRRINAPDPVPMAFPMGVTSLPGFDSSIAKGKGAPQAQFKRHKQAKKAK